MGALSRIRFVPGRLDELGALERVEKERRGGERDAKGKGGGDAAKTGFGGAWVTPLSDGVALEWDAVVPSGPGLRNLGNTCFMNASLQCLLHTPPMQRALAKGFHSRTQGKQHSAGSFCCFCAFESLYGMMYGTPRSRDSVVPRTFVQNQKAVCRTFRPGRQEDAHEFVRHVLDGMVKSSMSNRGYDDGAARRWDPEQEMKTIVHTMFGGCLQSSVTCLSCQAVSVVNEPFLDLSLEINNASSVTGALHKFTAKERLDGNNKYRCEKCKAHVAAVKRLIIRRAPNVLTLHLKRFDHVRKNTKHVAYDDQLDLRPHMIGYPDKREVSYRLCGVLIHQGSSMHAGHYYSYVRNSNGTWSLKDDESSHQVGAASVLRQNAYILFYVREPADEPKAPVTPFTAAAEPLRAAASRSSSEGFFSTRTLSVQSFLSDDGESASSEDSGPPDEGRDGSAGGDSDCSVASADGEDEEAGSNGPQGSLQRGQVASAAASLITESTRTLGSDDFPVRAAADRRANGSSERIGHRTPGPPKRVPKERERKFLRKAVALTAVPVMSLSSRSYLRLTAMALAARTRSSKRQPGTHRSARRESIANGTDRPGSEVANRSAPAAAAAGGAGETAPNGGGAPAPARPRPPEPDKASGTPSRPGVVFQSSGTWDDDEPQGARATPHQNGVAPTVPKRQRVSDPYDREYDAGKVKKVRVRNGESARDVGRARALAFQRVAAKKFSS